MDKRLRRNELVNNRPSAMRTCVLRNAWLAPLVMAIAKCLKMAFSKPLIRARY